MLFWIKHGSPAITDSNWVVRVPSPSVLLTDTLFEHFMVNITLKDRKFLKHAWLGLGQKKALFSHIT